MAAVNEHSCAVNAQAQGNNTLASTLTTSIPAKTDRCSRSQPHDVADPLTQLPLEILEEILSLIFADTYRLGHVPPVYKSSLHRLQPRSQPRQTMNSPSIFCSSSALSKVALSYFYSRSLFKLDPFFQNPHLMPALSQPQANLIQNISFTISSPYGRSYSKRDLQIRDLLTHPAISRTIILNKFTGDTTIRKTCTVEYHYRSTSEGPFADINIIVHGVAKCFVGFQTVGFRVLLELRHSTSVRMGGDGTTPAALERVVQSSRAEVEPTLGVGVGSGIEYWPRVGEEKALGFYSMAVVCYPRRYVDGSGSM